MNKVLVSLLAGVIIGIFIAPAKGSETWKKISNKLDEFSDNTSDSAKDLYKRGRKKINEGKSAVDDLVS